MAAAGVGVNVVLMVLNLLPILPLDGGRIATSLLPNRFAVRYARLEPYGFPILLLLLFTNVLGVILGPVVNVSEHLIENLFQIQL
jgi:Zn-dependent protease